MQVVWNLIERATVEVKEYERFSVVYIFGVGIISIIYSLDATLDMIISVI
jgi:hypothetical protein